MSANEYHQPQDRIPIDLLSGASFVYAAKATLDAGETGWESLTVATIIAQSSQPHTSPLFVALIYSRVPVKMVMRVILMAQPMAICVVSES